VSLKAVGLPPLGVYVYPAFVHPCPHTASKFVYPDWVFYGAHIPEFIVTAYVPEVVPLFWSIVAVLELPVTLPVTLPSKLP